MSSSDGSALGNRRLAREVVRRPSPAPRPEPTADEVRRAQEAHARHIPSMFTYLCLGCDQEWPCRSYREAAATLGQG